MKLNQLIHEHFAPTSQPLQIELYSSLV